MKTRAMFFLSLFSLFLYGAVELPGNEPSKDPVREKKATLTAEQMTADVEAKAARVAEIEKAVKKMQAEAVEEKDVKWKICLGDILATIRGIAASIENAKERMGDLIRTEKNDAAQTQVMLVRGLADAAEKAFVDAQACPRQLTRVDNRATVEKEQKKDITGTYGEEDSIGDAMGQDFSSDWATERDPGNLGTEDLVDGAGTDNPGGPTETPGEPGGTPGTVAEHGDQVSIPPFVEASPEK